MGGGVLWWRIESREARVHSIEKTGASTARIGAVAREEVFGGHKTNGCGGLVSITQIAHALARTKCREIRVIL
jgi:hypothetical protein